MRIFFALLTVFVFVASSLGAKNEICNLPTSVDGDGLRACLAYIPSFSYNKATNECVEFVYGGCGGNENRFGSLQDCEKKCKE